MLTNAGAAGLLGAAYLTILVLQLNPEMPLDVATLVPMFTVFTLFHGVLLAAAYYGLVLVLSLLYDRPTSPGWLSVRMLSWLGALTAGLGALVMWLNLRGFDVVLAPGAARRMALGTLATAVSALALLSVAIMHDSLGRRGSRLSGAVLGAIVLSSLLVALTLRGSATRTTLGSRPLVLADLPPPEDSARVIMLALDGASLDYISPAVAEGRLPNFGKILDTGASMHLVTIRPTQPGPVWTALATGKYPPKNGVRSAATYRWSEDSVPIELLPDLCFSRGLVYVGLLSEAPNISTALDARPLWSILSGHGLSVGMVGWPMTYPSQAVRGYLATERVHRAADEPDLLEDDGLAYPRDVIGVARDVLDGFAREAEPSVAGGVAEDALVSTAVLGAPTQRDQIYSRLADALDGQDDTQFVSVHYQGLDTVGHRFLRYAIPRSFGDVSEDDRRRFGSVLERQYAFIDAEVGEALERLRPNDLLLVVSGFGMEPVSLGKRLLARVVGDPDVSGSHERAPDGFLLAYGDSVASGRLPLAAIVDVVPTVLYFLGVPVARDMDGFARTDTFTRLFTDGHPITFIPSHDR